jgi:hypothetical protein
VLRFVPFFSPWASVGRLLRNLRTLRTLPLLCIFMHLPDVDAGSVLYGRVLLASYPGRIGLLPGALLEPLSPVLPPGALVLLGVLVLAFASPVASTLLRWGDHAGYVSAGGKGKVGAVGVAEDLADLSRRLPGHDVVLLCAHGVDVSSYAPVILSGA